MQIFWITKKWPEEPLKPTAGEQPFAFCNATTAKHWVETLNLWWKQSTQHHSFTQSSHYMINDITSVPEKLSDRPKIKFPVHSHLEYILQKVFKMTVVKFGRLSLIGIYWYQSTKRFIKSHLLLHSHKGGLTRDLMIKPPLRECINKLENYI